MSKYRKEIEKIHKNTDFRKTYAGVTELGEFVYKEHGSSVQPGLDYHIHYTNNKNEIFMLGGAHNPSSKIIEKVGGSKTLFKRYTELSISNRIPYPKIKLPNPSKSDYGLGSFTRYFAQSLINTNADIFEILDDEFEEQNNSFRYIDFDWRLSGTKEEVTRDNQRTMNFINTEFPGIARKLLPLQFWKPSKNSPESLTKKLTLLKKY
tara:strand:- start:309 stop:929 length:621 start_codon:yes stop_codon:yes gene_type:complete